MTALGLGGVCSIPIGPILCQSSLGTVTGTPFQQVVFNTGGVSLTPGSQYALLLTTTGLAGSVAGVKFGFVGCCSDPYALGRTVSDDNSQHASVPFYSAYGNTNYDVAFTASFDSVAVDSGTPEPATGFLLFAGIVACASLKLQTRVLRNSHAQ